MPRENSQKLANLLTITVIFAVVWITHWCCVAAGPEDSLYTVHTAVSILQEGTTNLDAFSEVIPRDDYRIEMFDGHMYSRLPIGLALVAVPFVFIVSRIHVGVWPTDLYGYLRHHSPDYMVVSIEKLAGSLLVALTTIVIFAIASRYLSRRYALLVAFIFAYGTMAWSTAGMALWSHSPSILFLSLSLVLVLDARDNPRMIQYAGLPLALAYLMRPTNAIPVVIWSLFVLSQYRRWFLRYLLWTLPVVLFFFGYNWVTYHFWLAPYYRPETLGTPTDLLVSLPGTLISPSRGLFVYSPVFIFSLAGVEIKRRTTGLQRLDYAILSILVLHWLMISANWSWWGGWSFGPRLFTDMVPYLVYWLIPAIGLIPRLGSNRKRVYVTVLTALILASVFIHLRGSTAIAVYRWNDLPTDVDHNPQRLWDWRDPQFLRGLGRS